MWRADVRVEGRSGRRVPIVFAGMLLLSTPSARAQAADTPAPSAATSAPPAGAFRCENPDEVAPGSKIVLRCEAAADLKVVTVMLFFRTPSREEYTPVPTLRVRKGVYEGTIHPIDLQGAASFHHYFEALDADDNPIASVGNEESPNLMFVRTPVIASATPGAVVAPAAPRAAVDENPLLAAEALDAPRRDEENSVQRRPQSIFIGVAVGGGYGWHPQRRLEYRRDLKVARGNGFAGRPHILPEVGYQLDRRLALSLQVRYQVVGSEGWGDIREGAPATHAWAALARARYFAGSRRARFIASVAAGAGDAFRVEVLSAPGSNLPRNDTVLAGPFVAGPGVGFLFHVNRHVALVAEARALAGFPRFATTMDASVGFELGF